LGGLARPLTLLFCDIRSFTTLSEGLSATELTRFLNEYLTPMTDAVLDAQGTVDKYMADAIMAFWNAPLDDPRHGLRAAQTALKMRDILAQLNRDWRRRDGAAAREVKFGVGLNTGECCVGNLGSSRRFDYSAIGDEVNVASRLEGASKIFGVDIVASKATRDQAPDFAWLEIDQVVFKNKTRPVSVHALVGDATLAASAGFRDLAQCHGAMLAAYRGQDFEFARKQAVEARKLAPDVVAGLYVYFEKRFSELASRDLGKDWRPVLTLDEK
jgi:adenylate cyclase